MPCNVASQPARPCHMYTSAVGGANVHKLRITVESNRSVRTACLFLVCWMLLLALTLYAQAPESGPKSGIVRQLSEVKFPSGDGPDCLRFFLENGDPKTGPSTAIMKAA